MSSKIEISDIDKGAIDSTRRGFIARLGLAVAAAPLLMALGRTAYASGDDGGHDGDGHGGGDDGGRDGDGRGERGGDDHGEGHDRGDHGDGHDRGDDSNGGGRDDSSGRGGDADPYSRRA